MSHRAYAKAQGRQKTLSGSPPKSSLLQRTCVYGGSSRIDGLCTERRDKQLILHSSPRGAIAPSASAIAQDNSSAQENILSLNSALDRASRFGHDFSRIPIHPPATGVIQTKLAINQPGDEYEQEADRRSEQIMRMATPLTPHVQRQTQAEQLIQSKVTSDAQVQTAPPIVREVLCSSGQPLDAPSRAFMEPRFGHDFSQVRVHTDTKAAESASTLKALAYTVGRDIVFGAGQYASTTHAGRKLMAHELMHVIQQNDTVHAQRRNVPIAAMQDVNEREAEHAALLIDTGRNVRHIDSPVLQRQPAPTDDPQKKLDKAKGPAQATPQRIPTPAARQEPLALAPPDGLQKIQKLAKNVLAAETDIAGGWTRHTFDRTYPFFDQNEPTQVGKQWARNVKKVSPNPPHIDSFYPAAGTHTVAAEGPGGPRIYEIGKDTAELLKQGEQEHIDDHLWAYTHTRRVIEEAINEAASLRLVPNEDIPGSIEWAKENPQFVVRLLTEDAFLSRLPLELRPLNLTKNEQTQKWWSAPTGVYPKLDQATKERDARGWHDIEQHLDSRSGQYVLLGNGQIGKHPSEDFMKAEYEKLKKG